MLDWTLCSCVWMHLWTAQATIDKNSAAFSVFYTSHCNCQCSETWQSRSLGGKNKIISLYPCFLQMESHELGEKVAACSNTHRITLTFP